MEMTGGVMLSFAVPLYPLGLVILFFMIRKKFTHTNLTMNPNTFRIKRTVQFMSKFKDSVTTASASDAPVSIMDRILCKQAEGQTSDLTKAEVRD